MNQIQPPQSDQAAGPQPADGAVNVPPSPNLTWITASNATSHRVYLGPSSPPPFYREQLHDLVPLTNLTLATTYYWRVDEVSPNGGGAYLNQYTFLADLLLFNEGDPSGLYTHPLLVASIAFVDRILSPAEIAALGPPRAEGIFVQSLQITSNAGQVELTWDAAPNVLLQKCDTLNAPVWNDVAGTLGAGSFSEPHNGPAFFRLLRR